MDVRVLTFEETQRLMSPAECLQAMEEVYTELGHGRGVSRPRSHTMARTDDGQGEDQFWYMLKTMEGVTKGTGLAALRISSGHQIYHQVNGQLRHTRRDVPLVGDAQKRWLELVMLFDIENGALLAVMPGGHIQATRVGAVGALGSKYM